MRKKKYPGLFDIAERANKLTQMGDPLVGLNDRIDWEAFRKDLSLVHEKDRKSNAGAKPIDVVLMFKVLVLQQLHNLSDDRIEYQIRDRLSFMRFLGLQLEDRCRMPRLSGCFANNSRTRDLSRHSLRASMNS
jgi:hypothetical protein